MLLLGVLMTAKPNAKIAGLILVVAFQFGYRVHHMMRIAHAASFIRPSFPSVALVSRGWTSERKTWHIDMEHFGRILEQSASTIEANFWSMVWTLIPSTSAQLEQLM
jgi:hypothetical protein